MLRSVPPDLVLVGPALGFELSSTPASIQLLQDPLLRGPTKLPPTWRLGPGLPSTARPDSGNGALCVPRNSDHLWKKTLDHLLWVDPCPSHASKELEMTSLGASWMDGASLNWAMVWPAGVDPEKWSAILPLRGCPRGPTSCSCPWSVVTCELHNKHNKTWHTPHKQEVSRTRNGLKMAAERVPTCFAQVLGKAGTDPLERRDRRCRSR